MEEISKKEIKKIMVNHSKDKPTREDLKDRAIIKAEIADDHGQVNTIVLSLNGSPPRAYAIYQKHGCRLSFFDSSMNRFKTLRPVSLI